MTNVLEKAADTILTQGVFGALFLLVAIGAIWVIRIMYQNSIKQHNEFSAQIKEEREMHRIEMAKLFEATEKLSADQRNDAMIREESWNVERQQTLVQLNKFNDSLAAINATLVGFSNLFQRVNDDVRDLKIIVSK